MFVVLAAGVCNVLTYIWVEHTIDWVDKNSVLPVKERHVALMVPIVHFFGEVWTCPSSACAIHVADGCIQEEIVSEGIGRKKSIGVI